MAKGDRTVAGRTRPLYSKEKTGDKLDNGMGEQTENVRSIEGRRTQENNGREKPCELTDRSKLRERGQVAGRWRTGIVSLTD